MVAHVNQMIVYRTNAKKYFTTYHLVSSEASLLKVSFCTLPVLHVYYPMQGSCMLRARNVYETTFFTSHNYHTVASWERVSNNMVLGYLNVLIFWFDESPYVSCLKC